MRTIAFVAAAVLAAAALAPDALPGEPAKDLKDKDFKVRMAAVEALESSGAKGAEALLVDALRDKDWQVVERAALALEKAGTAACVDDLVAMALEGPVRRIRLTAARSAGKIDADRAIERLGRRIGGEAAVRALEAIGAIVAAKESEAAAKLVDDALRPSKRHPVVKLGGRERDPVRKAAASALRAFPTLGRVARVEKLMFDADIAVACAAIDTVVAAPDPAFTPALLSGLAASKLDDCVERRLRNALRAIVASRGADAAAAARPIFDALSTAPSPAAAARMTRLIGDLGKAPPPPEPDAPAADAAAIVPGDRALEGLSAALSHADPKVRSACAVALGRIRTDAAVAQALSLAAKDADARVRAMAVRALAASATAEDSRAFKVFTDLLGDADLAVREEAAVALGRKGVRGAIPALAKAVEEAIQDRKQTKWALGTVALVSMGKTRDPEALAPLTNAMREAKDWRLVASAVVGLGRLQSVDAVDVLIEALDEKDPCVKACAYEFLRRLSSKEIDPDSKAWRAWWKVNRSGYVFVDQAEEARKAKKYGYAPSIEGLYTGLDIVVLGSIGGGDHIEDLLASMKIKHRMTMSPRVHEAGLHPYLLFVANCWGKIQEDDVDTLAWFVRAGGYLFSSCWALEETVVKVYPGVMRRWYTPIGQVLDYTPIAEPCVPGSPYLDGVFDDWTQPQYVLEGAYLIEVLDPDRCEVLIDSPEAAACWGSGNMAAWFEAGHGVVLDSVNHFSHQGFHFAPDLKTAEDRMAYAVDHMGVTYADLRDFAARKVFDSPQRCEKEVSDESAFRFLSTFVRHKRRVDL